MFEYTHVRVPVHGCACVYICACMCLGKCVCVYVSVHAFVCAWLCLWVRVCVCVIIFLSFLVCMDFDLKHIDVLQLMTGLDPGMYCLNPEQAEYFQPTRHKVQISHT